MITALTPLYTLTVAARRQIWKILTRRFRSKGLMGRQDLTVKYVLKDRFLITSSGKKLVLKIQFWKNIKLLMWWKGAKGIMIATSVYSVKSLYF